MMKRVFDIICSFIGLVILSPLFLIIVVILLVAQKMPVFFVQERIGKGGKPFNIYKFRSMKVSSENDGIPRLAQKNDNRLTTVGKILRKHHLDELPQLWNVLKGDMSIVGPRPERQYYINQIMERNPRYEELYQIRPGLTSYATLHNGYTNSVEKMLSRLEMDLDYLEHRSIGLDLKIIFSTIVAMFAGENGGKAN